MKKIIILLLIFILFSCMSTKDYRRDLSIRYKAGWMKGYTNGQIDATLDIMEQIK